MVCWVANVVLGLTALHVGFPFSTLERYVLVLLVVPFSPPALHLYLKRSQLVPEVGESFALLGAAMREENR